MSGERLTHLEDPILRQTAFSVEQMAPGGIERPDAGIVRPADFEHARRRLDGLLARPSPMRDDPKRRAVEVLHERVLELEGRLRDERTVGVVYLAPREFELPLRLRSPAIEIDFCFGDKDGVVSVRDINEARRRYGQVRGPVGWNRLLQTDEVERHLYPERTLKTTEGLRLLPEDWLVEGADSVARLRKLMAHLDDAALARTYADIAARLATVARDAPSSHLAELFEGALQTLGAEIRSRDGIRPTITDIARIGCEDAEVKQHLRTPIEMSRKLHPSSLIDRYLEV
jgi:hypothetical protein